MKTTVVLLIDVLQNMGGAEKNVMQLAKGLNPDKYRILVCCLKGGKVFEEMHQKGFNVFNLDVRRIYDFNGIRKAGQFIRMLKKENVKVLMCYFESSDFWGSICARIAGVPVILSSRRDMGFNLKPRHVFMYRFINPLFNKIIAVCDAVKNELIKREGIRPDKIVTIYNGVAPSENGAVSNVEAFKKSLGLDHQKKTVTMVGTLYPIKGQDDLLRAAAKVIAKRIPVQFLLVGGEKNGFKKELMNLAQELGIEKDVVFTGPRSDIPQILSVSDIAVLSSRSEGFSNALIEYMDAQKPVVATDVGGNKEIVAHGETGYVVPSKNPGFMAEAIAALLVDERLCKRMGEKARERVEECFAQEKMIENIEKLSESLSRGKG